MRSKHPDEMTREELLELVGDMTLLALDLAQHLRYAEGLKEPYLREAVREACKMAYKLAYEPFCGWESNAEVLLKACEEAHAILEFMECTCSDESVCWRCVASHKLHEAITKVRGDEVE